MALEAVSAMERIEKDMEQRRLKRQANQTVENGMTKRRLKQRPLSLRSQGRLHSLQLGK